MMKRNEEYSNIHTTYDSETFHFNLHSKVLLQVMQHTKMKPLDVNGFWLTGYEPSLTYRSGISISNYVIRMKVA